MDIGPAEKIHFTVGGKRQPSASLSELKVLAEKGELKRTDRVWARGMKEWQMASAIPEIFQDAPPPLSEGKARIADQPPEWSDGLATGAQDPQIPKVEKRDDSPPAAAFHGVRQRSPGLMALASFILPGLGQTICGQDGKGLVLIMLGVVGNLISGGLTSLLLCPLMAWDAFGIAKKNNEGRKIEKWEFFPTVPRAATLSPVVIPTAIFVSMLLLVLIQEITLKRQQDAEHSEQIVNILQSLFRQ